MKIGGCQGQGLAGESWNNKLPGAKKQNENFCGCVNVLYLNWVVGYLSVHICQKPYVQLKLMNFVM